MPHTESGTYVAEHREAPTPQMSFTLVDEEVTKPHQRVNGANGHVSLSHPREQHDQPLPYWLVNVPREQWPETCPEWLRDTSEKNKGILATPDEEFERLSWEEVKEIVRSNRIELFRRVPSELRRYLEYMHHIKQQYGSVMGFVLEKRLRWGDRNTENVIPRGRPFEYDDDVKILYNDWPYGLEPGIVHLVVWTKFGLDEDPDTGDLTDPMRRQIDEYVDRTFRSRVPADQVIWFKNWRSLKSIHAIEHFHVMLYRPDPEFVREVTEGDVPLVERVRRGESF